MELWTEDRGRLKSLISDGLHNPHEQVILRNPIEGVLLARIRSSFVTLVVRGEDKATAV
jgi:hypothetical protein